MFKPKQKSRFTPEYIRKHKEEHLERIKKAKEALTKKTIVTTDHITLKILLTYKIKTTIALVLKEINTGTNPEKILKIIEKNKKRILYEITKNSKHLSQYKNILENLSENFDKLLHNKLLKEIRLQLEKIRKKLTPEDYQKLSEIFRIDYDFAKSTCIEADSILTKMGLFNNMNLDLVIRKIKDPFNLFFVNRFYFEENPIQLLQRILSLKSKFSVERLISLFTTKEYGLFYINKMYLFLNDKSMILHEYIHSTLETKPKYAWLSENETFVQALSTYVEYKLTGKSIDYTHNGKNLRDEYIEGIKIGERLALESGVLTIDEFISKYQALS